MINPVINFYKTKDEAFSFDNSWTNQFYNFKGVQLIPNTQTKYIQATNTLGGVILEDWTVNVVDLCTEVQTNITSKFNVEKLFNSDNGDPQIVWSLQNIVNDFGYNLVYLEITQTLGETFYTNPFLITAIEEDKTSIFHYKENKTDDYQCIGFRTWFRQNSKKTELTTYYEISTETTVTQSIKRSKYKMYQSEVMNVDLLLQLTEILECPYLYVNDTRASLYEAVDIPTLKNNEAFGFVNYSLSFDYRNIYQDSVQEIEVPTTILVNIVPYKSGANYTINTLITLPSGYTSIVYDGSFVKLNTQTGISFTGMSLISGNDYVVSCGNTTTFIVSGEITVGSYYLAVTNGTTEIVYNISDANITFSSYEVLNNIAKPLILNIG
jgi:hypothetical protein